MLLELFWNDLRLAGRHAVRRPGFTLLIAITLALGVGVNGSVFAMLDRVLLRPLPYRDPSRLVFVWQTLPEHNVDEVEATPFDYAAWHELRSFAALGMVSSDTYTLSGDDNPERVRGTRMTASVMPLLGIAPRVGRAFEPAEDDDGAAPVVVLADGLWKRRYGADPSIIGRGVAINGVTHSVVGIMPPSASLPGPLGHGDDLWLPARMAPSERDNSISHNYTVIARLAETATLSIARTEADAFARRMAAEHPNSHRALGARLVPVEEQTVRAIRPALLLASGGVALLLLVAWSNACVLMLARTASRRHEAAVRAALGASASRLLSLAVAESLVVGGVGALAALFVGHWSLHVLQPLFAASLPASSGFDVDGRAVSFTAALTLVAAAALGGIVSGRRPHAIAETLRVGRPTGDASATRARTLLVIVQVAFSVTLLCGAGLLVRSVIRLSHVSPGFDARQVLTFRIAPTGERYGSAAQRTVFVRELVDRLNARHGIEQAAVTSTIPFGGARGANGVEIEGRAVRSPQSETIVVDQRHVTAEYFQVMRIHLLSGRVFTWSDDAHSERVVVINRAMAERYFGGESPLGRRIRVTAGLNAGAWSRIVGVTDNVRHIALSREAVPEMYSPYPQAAVTTFTLVARTIGEPALAMPAAREVLRALDPTLPFYDVQTMDQRIASSFAEMRAMMLLLGATAFLTVSLAAIAIYGSILHSVSQRVPEIGLRRALGATGRSVCMSVAGQAFRMTAAGTALGIAATAAGGPLLRAFLFETPVNDATTLLIVAATLLAVTVVACLVPVRRALSVDPIAALRSE